MNKLLALFAFSVAVPAWATSYTVAAGSSSATIQAILNTAGAAPGNTVLFSAGAYTLSATLESAVYQRHHLYRAERGRGHSKPFADRDSDQHGGHHYAPVYGLATVLLSPEARDAPSSICVLAARRAESWFMTRLQGSSFRITRSIATTLRRAAPVPNQTYGSTARIRPSPRPTEYSTLRSSGIPSLTTVPRFEPRPPPTRVVAAQLPG